jgi:Recombinase
MHVIELRQQGLSLAAISVELNRERIPTPTGRPTWRKSSVDRLLNTLYVREILDQLAKARLEIASAQ